MSWLLLTCAVVSPLAEPDEVVSPAPALAASRAFATSPPAGLAFAPLPVVGVARVVMVDAVRFAFAVDVLAALVVLVARPVEPVWRASVRDGVDDVDGWDVSDAADVDAVESPLPVDAGAPVDVVVPVDTGAEVC